MFNLGFFFFNDTATTEIYTLSLHDALPISSPRRRCYGTCGPKAERTAWRTAPPWRGGRASSTRTRTCAASRSARSEEHTSELQSQSNLVCRLLLEKKKKSYAETAGSPKHKH